ncbi:MAG: glutamate formimidoyltransferase [Chloroflexi bacterium]|nr:glutamate formimidoyltransferase [Chloroflexota bacterium]
MPMIECVPNFSEGRRKEIVSAIVDAMRVPGASIIDVSSDADHNRSVVTLVGGLDAVAEAAFRGVKEAAALIDMRRQSGVHPRIGAADVVPLIPLRDVSLAECATAARTLGARVGAELGLPVFLYDAAALRPDRVTLPQVRRDPYEALVETIASDPSRTPDYGPAVLGTAGAVAVGARGPLIAFNAYLDTGDVSVAQEIAREIRESGGGMPSVRALGLLVNGTAQVSMNLIDFRVTGMLTALDAVRQAAAARGHRVERTELIGLAPLRALVDAALSALQLPAAAADLILEARIGRTTGDYRPVPFE